ncbi:MAG: trehalose-phosphatase, partial [Gemmatimonadales bacterium]
MSDVTLPIPEEVAARLDGTPLVLMLDVDGTLAPIAPRPEDAAVAPATREVLERLVASRGVHVVLVSGRAAADARGIVAVNGVWT